ncbi:IS5 family transposase [Chromobacterium sp. ASV23]|uniref:IS5 family transposase n=1 Tax=Chromobacterium sp. ASV23 TaxID=2795110 RepID=UPI002102E7DD|nr:IS5 family transposase [Chromobacterium sp. ASV23]
MTKPAPKRYRTTNWKAYNQALIQRGSLSVWFDTTMSWQATPQGKRGRTQTYSDVAIQFCLTIKNLFGLPLRQTIGFIQSLLKLAGLDWSVPDYSTLSRRQQTLQVQIPYQKGSGALHLLVDSTGIKMLGEGNGMDAPSSKRHRSATVR